MKLIAVTGGIGAGKSRATREFSKLGADIISADKISHEVMKKYGLAYNETVNFFGRDILLENGEINRAALGKIVFSNSEKLKKLNDITHKHIFAGINDAIKKSKADVVCVEVPLLFTSKCPIDFDLTIAVIADDDIRVKRVMNRDNCTEEEARMRMAKQLGNEEYKKLADVTIENNGNKDTFRQNIVRIYNELI